jgi:hypothetical protein
MTDNPYKGKHGLCQQPPVPIKSRAIVKIAYEDNPDVETDENKAEQLP